jgi:hypothetical protein
VRRAGNRGHGIALLDLRQVTATSLEETGDQLSRALFLWIEPAKCPTFPDGRQDTS